MDRPSDGPCRWRPHDLPTKVLRDLEAIEALDWGDMPPGGYPRATEAEPPPSTETAKGKRATRKDVRRDDSRGLFGE